MDGDAAKGKAVFYIHPLKPNWIEEGDLEDKINSS